MRESSFRRPPGAPPPVADTRQIVLRCARRVASLLSRVVATSLLLLTTATAAESVKTVLVVYGDNAELPWIKVFDESLRSAVTGGTKHRVEFFNEYFDINRFPDTKQQEALIQFIRARYADRRIDVLVSGGATAFDFLLSPRKSFFHDVPLVYSYLPPDRGEDPALPPGVVGVPVDFGPMPTIELALRLHPSAKRLVLVTGAGPWDLAWEKRLRNETSVLRKRVALEFLAGLPTARVLERLSALPKEALVFTPGYFRDGAGAVFTPHDAVEVVAAKSTAPVYVAYDTTVGTGAVGGVIPTFDAVGRQTGEIVAALLEGKSPATLKLPRVLHGSPLVDWRQVRRWGIDEGLLPPGTVVRYREPSAWDKYRLEISIGIAIVALQTALIVALLFERRLRRRTAVALDDSEERMKLAARAAGLSMWTWDTTRDRVRSTTPSRQPARLPKEQSIDSGDFLERVHPGDREEVERAARQALAKGEELDIQYRLVQPDGEVRWIAAHGRAQKKNGRLLGVAHDITGRRLAELQAERDRTALRHMTRVSLLGQLSASIAHQLNQPLAAILGNAEAAHKMLARKQVDLAELREICEDIVTEDHRAVEVIRGLGALYRRGELQLQPLDLNELVPETLELVRTELLTRHVIPITELAPSLPVVDGDRVQLQQVLLNLIVNAADAMGGTAEEERTLTIRTDLTGGDVRVCVTDRGSGIAAEDLEHLFEPFWSGKPGGVGIGLAICRSIVAAHRGSLTAANNPGGGATFCATVPVRKQA
jgi:signal transduction histidine kinase